MSARDGDLPAGVSCAVLLALLLVVVLAAAAGWKNSRSRAERAVESTGASDVKLGGWAWFSCGKDDTYAWKFDATNAKGEAVSGYACCGLLKGCTVRY